MPMNPSIEAALISGLLDGSDRHALARMLACRWAAQTAPAFLVPGFAAVTSPGKMQ